MNQNLKLIGQKPSPNPWLGFIGQQRLREFITRIYETALRLGNPFPHSLITGPSGSGKTLLASRIADALGSNVVSFLANQDFCRNDLSFLFSKVTRGTIIHIDEAHSLQRCAFEFFYDVIDKGTIPTPGERTPDVLKRLTLPPFTLIFSTNYPGKIPKPLRSRLMPFEMDDYSNDDLSELALQKLGGDCEPEALEELVVAAQGNPRLMLQGISQLRMITSEGESITATAVKYLFSLKDVGPEGLSKLQQEYMRFLETQPEQRCLVTSLCHHLGIDAAFLRKEVEPYLVRCGFISYGAPGRKLSKRGRHFVNSTMTTIATPEKTTFQEGKTNEQN